MKTYIHAGVDKCGSSSLQRFLSINGSLLDNKNRLIIYKCLTRKGLLSPQKIKSLSNKNKNAYKSSMDLKNILNIENYELRKMFEKYKISNPGKNLQILSCEGWYRGLKNEQFISKISNFLEDPINDKLVIIAFLRSPVLWINSAWWQWGAWESKKNKYQFDEWLEKETLNVNWYRHFGELNSLKKNFKLVLKPLKKDIIVEFSKILNLKGDLNLPGRINTGLPLEILKLYLKYPKFKFILKKIFVNKNFVGYGSTPWILSKSNIRFILNNTYKNNKKLLNLLDEEDKLFLLNDKSWWDIDFYKDKVTYDPYLEEVKINKNLIELFFSKKIY